MTSAHSALRPRLVGLLGLPIILVLAACGGGSQRPAVAAWQETWDLQRELFPDADMIIAGGPDFCAELVGELRTALPELRPTPTEALDNPVASWVAHAETIAFECPQDRSDLSERLRVLDDLAAEIDAGIVAAEGGA